MWRWIADTLVNIAEACLTMSEYAYERADRKRKKDTKVREELVNKLKKSIQ